MLRFAVVEQGAVALADLLELPQRVGAATGVAPHLLALNEKGVPVIDPRVDSQQPEPWFGRELRHPSNGTIPGALYTVGKKSGQLCVQNFCPSAGNCSHPARSGSANINENVVAAHLDRVGFDANGRICRQLAGGDVVLPAVPGAGDDLAFEVALAKRAAAMEAYIIDYKQLTANIGKGDCLAVELKFADCPRRDLVLLCGAHKSHSLFLPRAYRG